MQGGLAGGVGYAAAGCLETGDGSDVYDFRAVCSDGFPHRLDRRPRTMEGTHYVYLIQALPDVVAHCIEIVERNKVRGARVIDEEIESTEFLDGGIDQGTSLIVRGNVGLKGKSLATGFLDGGDHFGSLCAGTTIVDSYATPFFSEKYSGSRSHTSARSRNQSNFSIKLHAFKIPSLFTAKRRRPLLFLETDQCNLFRQKERPLDQIPSRSEQVEGLVNGEIRQTILHDWIPVILARRIEEFFQFTVLCFEHFLQGGLARRIVPNRNLGVLQIIQVEPVESLSAGTAFVVDINFHEIFWSNNRANYRKKTKLTLPCVKPQPKTP